MKSNYRCGALLTLVVVLFLIVLPRSTSAFFGDEPKWAHINSPLNENNVEKILENKGKFTDAEIVEMLGPPTSIEMGGRNVVDGEILMSWEDLSRIELTCREGKVVALKGTFSPRFVSESINYSTFKKLEVGMTVNEMCRQFFLGHRDRIVEKPDGETSRIFEQYVRFYVRFKDGKAQSANRVEFRNR